MEAKTAHKTSLIFLCAMILTLLVLKLFSRQGFEVSIGEMESALPRLGLRGKSQQMTVEELRRETYMKEAIKILSEKAIGSGCSELMSKLPAIRSIHSNMSRKTTLPSMNSPG